MDEIVKTTDDLYAEIDAELEAEFEAGLAEEQEQLEEQVDEVETPEDVKQEDTEEETHVDEQDTPANRAFAEQRLRIKQLEEEQARKDHLIQMVLEGSGMESEEEFMKALEQSMKLQEQQELGVDDRGYHALEQERKQREMYKQQLEATEQRLAQRNLSDFDLTVKRYEQDYGFTREEIFTALDNDGVTVNTIQYSNDHDRLIKTSMLDRIVEAKAQQLMEKEANRGQVDEARHTGPTNTGELSFEEQQEALLDADIAEYIKNKGY